MGWYCCCDYCCDCVCIVCSPVCAVNWRGCAGAVVLLKSCGTSDNVTSDIRIHVCWISLLYQQVCSSAKYLSRTKYWQLVVACCLKCVICCDAVNTGNVLFWFTGWTESMHIQFNQLQELCNYSDADKLHFVAGSCVYSFSLQSYHEKCFLCFISFKLQRIIWNSSKCRAYISELARVCPCPVSYKSVAVWTDCCILQSRWVSALKTRPQSRPSGLKRPAGPRT